MNYNEQILGLHDPSFEQIRKIAIDQIAHLTKSEKDQLWEELKRGVALLNTHEQLCQYLFSFGKMHQAKLKDAYSNIKDSVFHNALEIVDWGCGQAMGTVNLFDYLKTKGLEQNIKKITLIEPAAAALERGKLHVTPYLSPKVQLVTLNKYFEQLTPDDIQGAEGKTVLHIFSNILDVAQIDLKHLANTLDNAVIADNYLVCVGPLNPNNHRIDAFYRYFKEELIQKVYQFQTPTFITGSWTYKAKIYKLEFNKLGHLIPIEYYPPVQFQAAYELDCIGYIRKKGKLKFKEQLTHFEVAAPFDLGASVYDDVHPVLAVLNNIICRGLPTKGSLYLEQIFQEAFGLTQQEEHFGEIVFTSTKELHIDVYHTLLETYLDQKKPIQKDHKIPLQLLLAPIAIARFQKVLLEAIITGQLSLEEESWKILIEEKDVPFGHLAVEDFRNHFYHLTQLSKEYDTLTLPNIDLYIISNEDFHISELQPGNNVFIQVPRHLRNMQFDMVVSQSILRSVSIDIEAFSKFQVKKDCYFNLRSISKSRSERQIYTSSLIAYKNLVERNPQGNYLELENTKTHIQYFLNLLFRKKSFRPGQLPILDRALQNLPVIGLLPTGGGKSLTYQIAALLQPGVTMVIDPLKSLMKDQLDGLINGGIDCAAYINSSLSKKEKEKYERDLESSKLLFVFLSPERLSIASFRDRLKHMNEYNVYFSYGVIDEVHCVSEWGHDFRFSYLHLGRNLYNYVRAKNKAISLFGLTATASYDVLADVERELSGNGAFKLDSDTIVRYENTNRFELQYKVERVSVQFEEDKFFDKNKHIDASLPRALNVTDKWIAYDSKGRYLTHYFKTIPNHLKELLKPDSINRIKEQFTERQNDSEGTDIDLNTPITSEYFLEKEEYTQAGIIFCPHVNKTGLSVETNKKNLSKSGVTHVASFSGKDEDDKAIENMEKFRNNKSPIMVATKAFGMGIDKPNVRFTVNMNYSSSLEAFVQEAGRAGRDKKIALATLLVSDYSLAQISKTFPGKSFPLTLLKNRWFKKEDLEKIIKHYDLTVPDEYIVHATPEKDIVKLYCHHDNKMFGFSACSDTCTKYKTCSLRKINPETRGWKSEAELIQEIKSQNLNISKKNFQYLNADYQTIMFFYNQSFKGDLIEKRYMFRLLMQEEIMVDGPKAEKHDGFLTPLLNIEPGSEITAYIPYNRENYQDLCKAIYRMCCIDLISDFTQDYVNQQFRIVAKRKAKGGYFQGLNRFLLRYYTRERAVLEVKSAKEIKLKHDKLHPAEEEIYKCLSYLIEFIYDKISEKRKRAIDDMRDFCMEGSDAEQSWLVNNERMKDFLYYYFNSKFAKEDYVAENGELFSLVEDTDRGKISNEKILYKYLRVIDDDVVGIGTPLDNVKHLHGAVRLISRSLTDSNPALSLLEVFCLAYLGIGDNQNLKETLIRKYSEGMINLAERYPEPSTFWEVFYKFNNILSDYLTQDFLEPIVEEINLLVHTSQFNKVKNKYLENYA